MDYKLGHSIRLNFLSSMNSFRIIYPGYKQGAAMNYGWFLNHTAPATSTSSKLLPRALPPDTYKAGGYTQEVGQSLLMLVQEALHPHGLLAHRQKCGLCLPLSTQSVQTEATFTTLTVKRLGASVLCSSLCCLRGTLEGGWNGC